jgi:phage-related minor tail protein
MAELESLSFRVDSSQLSEAASKIAALTAAIALLSASQLSAAEAGKQTAKAERQAAKDASALLVLKQKLADAEAKAAAASNGNAGATRTALTEGEKMANLLSRLTNLHHDMAAGSTRGESAILQMARSLNATDAQMQAVRASLQQIAGLSASPFDNSLGAIRNVQREMQALNDRSQLAARGISLTTQQLQDFSRIGNEIRGKMSALGIDPTTAAGAAHFTSELKKQQDAYILIAGEVNRVTSEEKKRNDALKAQANIMAELEQKNRSIQELISRNQSITSSMQTGTSQTQAGTNYDNSRLIAGAATPEQLARIQERITLTQKLTESEKLLNVEVKAQDDLLKHIEGLVSQRKAIDDLNKSVIANVAERKKMDNLMQKYTGMGLNNTNASEVSKLEFKGASQASIDSLKNYLLGVQASNKALEDQRRITDEIERANERTARAQAAARYSAAGNSSSISNTAAGMEVKGVSPAAIASYIQEAKAKEDAAKAGRELASANKYITETEERLASAVNNANQNLNRQSTDELVKYQRALATVGTSTDDTTRKMAALKAQLDLVAGKERANQLNHLSRAISTQMGDVGISLASGMNPLTVMLQQGDQIRFALQQAGAEGAELQRAMSGAASQIASSIVLTAKAMGGFFTGTLVSMGGALSGFVLSIGGLDTVLRNLEVSLAINAAAGGAFEKAMYSAFNVARLGAIAFAAAISATLIVGLVAATVALYQVNKEQQALSVSMAQAGGAFGFSRQSAMEYAAALESVQGHTGAVIKVIDLMAKSGSFTRKEIDLVAKSAIEMEKYAGVALEDTVKSFEKLKAKPVEAILELAAATGKVAPEVVKAVIELEKQGRMAEATAQAMQILASTNSQSVAQIKEDFTDFANFMKGVYAASLAVYEGLKAPIRDLWTQDGSVNILKKIDEASKAVARAKKGIELGVMVDMNKKILEQSKGELNAAMTELETFRKVKGEAPGTSTSNSSSADILKLTKQARLESETAIDKKKRQIEESNQQFKDLQTKYGAEKGNEMALTAFRLENEKRVAKYKDELKGLEEAKSKKDKGPKAKTSSFGGVPSEVSLVNNTPNIQREYSSELSKTEKFIKSQRDILKMSYEAGLVSKGEYIAKDTNLIISGQAKELSVITEFGKRVEAEQEKITKAINARRTEALNATKDPASRTKINLAADDELKKVKEAGKTFSELHSDKKETVDFESTRRFYESLKEQNAATIESKKHLDELNKSMQDASEIRKLDAEYQVAAMSLSGSEVAMYKAKNDVLQNYIKIKSKIQGDLDKAEKTHTEFTDNMQYDGESQQKALQLWMQVQTLKDQVTKAGIASELEARNAATDAFNKYYMDKAMEVRDGTANAITEGIMNGGQAGSQAIKAVLDNILKDLLNNVFKKILGSVGDMILNSIMQSQMAASTAKSGGGFLEGLVSMGFNALAGGVGGGSGAGATSQYSLSSGSTDMTSGFKMRATGGFVNQGSEYMVGENGPEKFIPKQTGSIVPNHDLAKSSSSEPLKLTIINNTSAPIGRVTERQISPTERALVIEDAVNAVASALYDPNHKVSKSFGNNFASQRKR